jgi:hypothetical protein
VSDAGDRFAWSLLGLSLAYFTTPGTSSETVQGPRRPANPPQPHSPAIVLRTLLLGPQWGQEALGLQLWQHRQALIPGDPSWFFTGGEPGEVHLPVVLSPTFFKNSIH